MKGFTGLITDMSGLDSGWASDVIVLSGLATSAGYLTGGTITTVSVD